MAVSANIPRFSDAFVDRPCVLVVEGDPAMRRLVSETLASDFTVVTAGDGAEGFEKALAPGLDLVVTGLIMPRVGGDEMIAAIRQRRDLDNLPILILSARADDTLRIRMLREGAQDYVVKPFTPPEVRARAMNLARVKRARDVLQAQVASQSSDLETLARAIALEKNRAQEAEQKADAASRAKDEFLAVLSHELRTPLNAIVGWTSILRRRADLATDAHHALEVIDRNAQAQARLIEDLLDVSAMIRGRLRLRLDPVPLRPVVAGALDTIRPTAEAKRVAVHSHCDKGDLTVLGDADRLRQVVYNLLTNAIKFTPEGGHVMVRCGVADEAIVISVEDTGIGIDPAFLPFVFERFTQADGTPHRRPGSLGLGLAIVRHVVELHGGSVRAESDGPGRGTTLTIRLPALVPDRVEPPAPSEPRVEPVPAAPLLGLRILFVEPDPDARTVVAGGLRQHGAIVASAATVGDAISMLEELKPDLFLGDLGAAGAEEYALLHLLQTRGRGIPAIALTAYALPDATSPARANGYWRQLGKPIDLAELVATISAATSLGQRRTMDEP